MHKKNKIEILYMQTIALILLFPMISKNYGRMESKLPTIKEIAKRLNISVSTVSRSLHDHPGIGLRTKMQVQELAKELNYEPNQTAIFFNSEKHLHWGLFCQNCPKHFFHLRSAA